MTEPQPLSSPPQRLTSEQAAELAMQSGLREMGVRPPLGRYLAAVWGRRSFIWNLSASRAYAKNQGSYLGQAWTVLRPVLDATVFVIVFGFIFNGARGLENRAAFITIGVFTWAIFQKSVTAGLTAIPSNLGLIRSHQFPRAVVPLSTAMTETVLFGPVLVAMVIVSMATGLLGDMGAVVPRWSWLLLPVAAALLAIFSAGLAMFFARLGARTPDIANIVPFLLSLGRFASGVMFSITITVSETNPLRPFLVHQPVAVFLTLFRSIFGNEPTIPMTWSLWLQAGAWALGAVVVGFLFFWSAEETYGRD